MKLSTWQFHDATQKMQHAWVCHLNGKNIVSLHCHAYFIDYNGKDIVWSCKLTMRRNACDMVSLLFKMWTISTQTMRRYEYSLVASLACGVDTVFGSKLSRFHISHWCGFSLPRLLSWHSHAWPHSFCCLLHFRFCPEPFVFFHCGIWVRGCREDSIGSPAITIKQEWK